MKSKTKIIFVGSVLFSKIILEKLIKLGVNIELIVCKKKSNFNNDFYDLSSIAIKNKINYIYSNNINSISLEKKFKSINPDVIFCFGWSQIIKSNILKIPKIGILGFHPTNIKLSRGCNPITWTLVLGLNDTSATFFWMNKKIDNGEIFDSRQIKVNKKDDAKSLYNKISRNASLQIVRIIEKLGKNKLTSKNNDINNGIYWRRRKFNDGQIDWRMNADNIYNLVRGLTNPYFGAHFKFRNKFIKVWKCNKTNKKLKYFLPGQIVNISKKKIEVKCGKGTVIFDNSNKLNLKIKDYIE